MWNSDCGSVTTISSLSERCSRGTWRWCTQRRECRDGTLMNSICDRSGQRLPDTTDTATGFSWFHSQYFSCYKCVCVCFVPAQLCNIAQRRRGFGSQTCRWKRGSGNCLPAALRLTEDHLWTAGRRSRDWAARYIQLHHIHNYCLVQEPRWRSDGGADVLALRGRSFPPCSN